MKLQEFQVTLAADLPEDADGRYIVRDIVDGTFYTGVYSEDLWGHDIQRAAVIPAFAVRGVLEECDGGKLLRHRLFACKLVPTPPTSAPLPYHLFLRESDIRYVPDVVRWLQEAPAADPVGKDYHACARIAARLEAVIERQRRATCKRAALDAWRLFSKQVREGVLGSVWRTAWDKRPHWTMEHAAHSLIQALAFYYAGRK